MLSFSFVTDTSMLYFVVICSLVLVSIIIRDRFLYSSISRISNSACKVLLFHSFGYITFCLLFFWIHRLGYADHKNARLTLVVIGLLTNYVSFVYPYVLLSLIRRYHHRNTFIKGNYYKAFSVFFFAFSILVFLAIGYAVCLVSLSNPEMEEVLSGIDRLTVIAGIICFVLVLPDFHAFIVSLLRDTFFTSRAISVALFSILYLQLLLLPLNLMFYAPVMYMFTVILVFVIHMVSQNSQISVDFLTGLNNRNSLVKYLDKLFSKRSELDASFKLIYIDIDDLNGINHHYGQENGDKAILLFSACMKKATPANGCFICRYKGDEFVAVLNENEGISADDFIKKVKENLKEANALNINPFTLNISVGYVPYSHDLADEEAFVSAARAEIFSSAKRNSVISTAPLKTLE